MGVGVARRERFIVEPRRREWCAGRCRRERERARARDVEGCALRGMRVAFTFTPSLFIAVTANRRVRAPGTVRRRRRVGWGVNRLLKIYFKQTIRLERTLKKTYNTIVRPRETWATRRDRWLYASTGVSRVRLPWVGPQGCRRDLDLDAFWAREVVVLRIFTRHEIILVRRKVLDVINELFATREVIFRVHEQVHPVSVVLKRIT